MSDAARKLAGLVPVATQRSCGRGRIVAIALGFAAACGSGAAARGEDLPKIAIVIQDHKFSPSEIRLPVGKQVILVIENKDATVEEFDSSALQVEKVIPGGHTGQVHLRPLGPGRYPFMGEYHSETAQGVVIAE